jgi:hypothetical protein
MGPVTGTKDSPPKPSVGMPSWIGYVGLAMFVPGCLAAAWGIQSADVKLGLSGAVLMSLGGLSMANGYAGIVRADLLRRIEELERRIGGGASADPDAADDRRGM